MTGFDYAAVTVIGLSTVLSLWRGAVEQLFSIAGWVLAFAVARQFAPLAQGWVPAELGGENLRQLLATAGLFLLTLVLVLLAGRLLAGLLRGAGLGVADRVLGILLGFVRGVLIVLFGVALAGMTPLPETLMWRQAASSAWFVGVVEWSRPLLPQAFAERIRYD